MVRIYAVSIQGCAGKTDIALSLLPASRREKASSYRRQEDRALCVAAGLLLEKVFGRGSLEKVKWEPYGRPYLEQERRFSLSHDGDYAVLVTAEDAVGVDIQRIEKIDEATADFVLTEREYQWAKAKPETGFTLLWTMKESLFKAAKQEKDATPVDIEIIPGQQKQWLGGEEWYLDWRLQWGYVLSCAAKRPFTIENVTTYDFDRLFLTVQHENESKSFITK